MTAQSPAGKVGEAGFTPAEEASVPTAQTDGPPGQTPGPWLDRDGYWTQDPNRLLTRTEDARIMGCAPELLECLEGIVHFTDGFGFYRTQSPAGVALEQWIEAAKDEIARATGASQ